MRVELAPDRELFPFTSRWFEGAGPRVHYVDEGSGPLVVMFHGNPTWSFLYRKVILGLRDRYRCIALDYPGFGLSERPAGYGYTPGEHAVVAGRLVDEIVEGPFSVMGQDWGGPIGMTVALERPERVRSMVFANTWFWPATGRFTAFSLVMSTPVLQWLILRRNFFVERIIPSGVRLTKLPDAVMDAYRGPFPTPESRRPAHVFPREILGSRPFLAEIEKRLPALSDRPALIVWPTKDVAFREPERRRWEQLFGEHRTVMLEGAGHYIQEDAPEEIIAAIRDWSGGQSSQSHH